MSRLSIEISEQQHKHIKTLAAMKGQSIKEFVIGKLFDGNGNDDNAYSEFKLFMQDRIQEARMGKLATRSPKQISEDILGK